MELQYPYAKTAFFKFITTQNIFFSITYLCNTQFTVQVNHSFKKCKWTVFRIAVVKKKKKNYSASLTWPQNSTDRCVVLIACVNTLSLLTTTCFVLTSPAAAPLPEEINLAARRMSMAPGRSSNVPPLRKMSGHHGSMFWAKSFYEGTIV